MRSNLTIEYRKFQSELASARGFGVALWRNPRAVLASGQKIALQDAKLLKHHIVHWQETAAICKKRPMIVVRTLFAGVIGLCFIPAPGGAAALAGRTLNSAIEDARNNVVKDIRITYIPEIACSIGAAIAFFQPLGAGYMIGVLCWAAGGLAGAAAVRGSFFVIPRRHGRENSGP